MKRLTRAPWASIVAALLLAAVAVAQTDPVGTFYAALRGRTGGQVLAGGRNASESLTLRSTTHATKGEIYVPDPFTWNGTSADIFKLVGASATMLETDRLNDKLLVNKLDVTTTVTASGSVTGSNLITVGVVRGPTVRGGTTASAPLALQSTSSPTKGNITADGINLTVAGVAQWIPIGAVDAATLDGLDSLQFLRSDASDNYTSGNLSFDSGTTLYAAGDVVFEDASSIALPGGGISGAGTGSGLDADLLDGLSSGAFQAVDADLTTIAGLTRTRGDTITGGTSDWIRLPLGSSGQVLKSNGTDVIWGSPGAGSGGALTLIGSVTVSGAAVTSIQFASLTALAQGEQWILTCAIYNPTAGTVSYDLQYNADTNRTNYTRQIVTANSTAISAVRQNNPGIADLTTGTRSTIETHITRDVELKTRAFAVAARALITAIEWQTLSHGWNSTANPTSLEVVAQTASGIGIGSEFRLFKLAGSWILFIPLFPMPLFRRRRYGARARTLVRGLGMLLIAGCASAQTPTPCVPQTLTRIVCVGVVCTPQQYQGCSGSETEAVAVAAAQALLDAEAAQASTDLASEVPTLKAQLVAALAQLDQEEQRAVAVQAESAAMLTAIAADPVLAASPSPAALRAAVLLLSGRIKTLAEHTRDAGLGAERNAVRTRRMLRALAAKLGIPVTQSQGLAPSGAQGGKRKS